MSDQISIIAPDDWHVHLRDGEMLNQVVAHTARRFQRAIVMPNLRPPVTTVAAARAYRESYSVTPNGATSSTALLKLGLALNGLGQTSEACITLGEVTVRFPESDASIEAQAARVDMGCS